VVGSKAYLKDLPKAEMHRLEVGDFTAGNCLDDIAAKIRRLQQCGGALKRQPHRSLKGRNMGRSFAQVAFTPLVKDQQQRHGSRRQYARIEEMGEPGNRLGPQESEFIRSRDGFYMASTSETGWPYIQYRGGPKGFLRIFDDQTLGFADLRGNRQYITVGNLQHDDRVALFLMDYAYQQRLKILGRATLHEGTTEAEELVRKLISPDERTVAERAVTIKIEAFDWNCPQHITPRYTEEELLTLLAPMRHRLETLEAENARLRKLAEPIERRN
jgi:predicted pyridoxine 5'-phosphate oxidase superfamily flavin-nucleotide-binding protein